MSNRKNVSIEQINDELRALGPEISKGKYIAGIAVFGGIAVVGLSLFAAGIFYYSLYKSALDYAGYANQSDYQPILNVYLSLSIIGGITTMVGAIFAPISGSGLKKTVRHNRRIDCLLKEKKSLENENVVQEQAETNEDTLLRLLSEGKITVEEYKKLSKK